MKPPKVVAIRRSFLKPDEVGKGRAMGFIKGLFGREPLEDNAERHTGPFAKQVPVEPPDVEAGRSALEFSRAIAGEEQHRAPMNQHGQLIVAGEVPQRTARELVESAGTNVPALASALGIIAQRFEDSVRNSDALNRAIGEFKLEVIQPFREELRFLRFNLGDKVNQTTTNMEVMVDKLEQLITASLRAQGHTDAQILAFRTENGMDRAPSGEELEIHVHEHEELLAQVATLTAQNQRLLAQLSAKHIEWPEDGGNWVYHAGCQCDACRAEELHKAMRDEVSGVARSRPSQALGRQDFIKDMPNPTAQDQGDVMFLAIWEVIKHWDVNVPAYYHGYCGANGSHVMLILERIRELQKAPPPPAPTRDRRKRRGS